MIMCRELIQDRVSENSEQFQYSIELVPVVSSIAPAIFIEGDE